MEMQAYCIHIIGPCLESCQSMTLNPVVYNVRNALARELVVMVKHRPNSNQTEIRIYTFAVIRR